VIEMKDCQSDVELARRAARGDDSSWRRIYDETSDRLFSLLCYQVGDEDEALDLLQDTYLQAFRRLNGYRGEAPLLAWLRVIALRKAIDWKRSVLRRLRRTAPLEEATIAVDADPPDPLPDAQPDALQRALAKLSDRQRAVLLLREWEEWSFREIAQALRCKESTARVHHARARRRMRGSLASKCLPSAQTV